MGNEQFGYFCLMKTLQGVFHFYLDASVHVAFSVFALVQVTAITLNISVNTHLSWLLFFGAISCYNFIKYGVEAEKYILVANRYHKNIQFVSFIAFGFAVYHAYFLSKEVWIGIVFLMILTGLYALPVLPNTKNLRSWGGLKIFIVALVWAGATVILPVLSAQLPISRDVGVETLQRFLFVLVLMIPFEIRDLVYDSPELKTVPQLYGVKNTKVLGVFALVFFFFLSFLKNEITYGEIVGKGMLFLILGYLLRVTKRDQNDYFASFWVEAIPLFWWGILFLLQNQI